MTPQPDATTGDPDVQDVVDVLTADHRRVEELIDRIGRTSEPAARSQLRDQLVSELVKHSVVEEMLVYPVMRTHLPDGDAAVDRDVAEHADLERTLKSIEGSDVGSAHFVELVRHLEESLRLHVADEEAEEFPRLRAAVPAEQLRDLAYAVRAAKGVVPTRPHPSTPHDPLSHLAVGPVLGVVDRLRDRLEGRGSGPSPR